MRFIKWIKAAFLGGYGFAVFTLNAPFVPLFSVFLVMLRTIFYLLFFLTFLRYNNYSSWPYFGIDNLIFSCRS